MIPVTEHSRTLQLWLDRCRAGDPDAVNELIRHSRDRLRQLTRQMLGQFPSVQAWEETSDVVQASLVRLNAALQDDAVRQRARTPRDLLLLAATHIRRQLIDLARGLTGPRGMARHQARPGEFEQAIDTLGPTTDDPFSIAAWHDLHQRIDRELTDPERELWELLYYQGVSQAQAAELLGLPERTIRRHWLLLRERLAQSMDGDFSSGTEN